jgi:hypothetical protein
MKLLILFVFLGLSLVSGAAETSPRHPHPEISNIFDSKKIKEEIIPEDDLRHYEATAAFLYGQGRFKQSGEGQNYDTKSAQGTGIGLEVLKKRGESFFRLGGQVSQTIFKEPTIIGGGNVTIGRQIWSFTYGQKNIFNLPQLSTEAGVGSIIQNADKFSNSAKLVPEYFSLGPAAALRWTQQLSEVWSFSSAAAVIVPLLFKDVGADNGDHSYGVYGSLNIYLRARLNRQFFFSFGVLLETEKHVFTGASSRGVEDADVSYLAIVLPMGINYVF